MKIMGIVNVTPDSFYDGGRYYKSNDAINHAMQLIDDGADIIDIGGESTRPGAKSVSAQEEIDRVCPVIEKVSSESEVPVSIDTTKSAVAEAAVKSGASIINDISGLTFDPEIARIAVKYNSSLVLMHIKGTPGTMQNNPQYADLLKEIYESLELSSARAMGMGVNREKIIIDPGIGFGKTLEHNYIILKNLTYFKKLGLPILVGLSRKSMIGKLYTDDSDRLPATIALNTVAILNGADIIRVHDVKEHRLVLKSIDMLQKVS